MSMHLPMITVSGTPYERGFQHGEQIGEQIRNFLADNVARINNVRKEPLTMEQALQITDRYIPWIEQDVPQLAEEVRGLADGAKITYREAMLLQCRREIIAAGLDCSALAYRNAQGEAVIAQNVDLPGNLTDLGIILKVESSQPDEPSLLMFTHVGLLGYLGINSHGLGIGLNMVLSPGWQPGVPPYLLIRHLLHQQTLDECLVEIRRIRRTSSRNLLLTDGERFLDVEMTVQEERLMEELVILHTNHFLHSDFCPVDLLPAGTSSQPRLERMNVLWEAFGGQPTHEQIEQLLSDHEGFPISICVHGNGDYGRGETIAAAILYPKQGLLYACQGNPCENSFDCFSIRSDASVASN